MSKNEVAEYTGEDITRIANFAKNIIAERTDEVVAEIVDYAKRVRDGLETVKPGEPLRFTEASTVNDTIWQGDMRITIVRDVVPDGYKKIDTKVQLVPGNTIGAKHCLDGTNGVEMYIHDKWNEETLDGPFMRLSQERTILHPTHGSVTIPAGFCVEIGYQREFDLEQQRERRAAD